MTATFAASVMKVPAEIAPAPRGVTKTIVGTLAFNIAWITSWVAETSPPGVSSSMRTASAPAVSARSIVLIR